jgi:hypothetical protein
MQIDKNQSDYQHANTQCYRGSALHRITCPRRQAFSGGQVKNVVDRGSQKREQASAQPMNSLESQAMGRWFLLWFRSSFVTFPE